MLLALRQEPLSSFGERIIALSFFFFFEIKFALLKYVIQ